MTSKNLEKYDTLGGRLRKFRDTLGLTQTEFAKELGFAGYSVISRFETNERSPNTETLLKMVELGSVDLHWLLTGSQSSSTTELINHVRPYAMAHLSEVANRLDSLERERRDLHARNAKGEQLDNAIKDIEALIVKEHRYYGKAFIDLDDALDFATHRDTDGKAVEVERSGEDKESWDNAEAFVRKRHGIDDTRNG